MHLPIRYSRSHWSVRREARQQYIREQEGMCWHCKCWLDRPPPPDILAHVINWDLFPPNFLHHPIHLHHDHDTDMTIGAVHAYCNAVLWQYHGQ